MHVNIIGFSHTKTMTNDALRRYLALCFMAWCVFERAFTASKLGFRRQSFDSSLVQVLWYGANVLRTRLTADRVHWL